MAEVETVDSLLVMAAAGTEPETEFGAEGGGGGGEGGKIFLI